MADNQTVQTPKKADLILQRQRELAAKQEEVLSQSKIANSRLNTALEQIAGARDEVNFVIHQGKELQAAIQTDYESLKQEFRFIAMQSESIFTALSDKVKELNDLLSKKQSEPVAVHTEEPVTESEQPTRVVYTAQQDID